MGVAFITRCTYVIYFNKYHGVSTVYLTEKSGCSVQNNTIWFASDKKFAPSPLMAYTRQTSTFNRICSFLLIRSIQQTRILYTHTFCRVWLLAANSVQTLTKYDLPSNYLAIKLFVSKISLFNTHWMYCTPDCIFHCSWIDINNFDSYAV